MNKKVSLSGKGRASELSESLKEQYADEVVSKIDRRFGNIEISQLVFERYFFRNNSSACLTVLLVSENEDVAADLVAAGDGAGILNWSLGAGERFIKDIEEYLSKNGMSRLT